MQLKAQWSKKFDHAVNNIIPNKFSFKKFKIHLKNCYELKIDTTIEQRINNQNLSMK
jgi:hypothetical protein